MVIQIDAEANDSVEQVATAAVNAANILGINVKFYYNRVGYFVRPNETVPEVVNSIKVIAKLAAKPKK